MLNKASCKKNKKLEVRDRVHNSFGHALICHVRKLVHPAKTAILNPGSPGLGKEGGGGKS